VCVFIGVSARTCISIYVYIVFLKKMSFLADQPLFQVESLTPIFSSVLTGKCTGTPKELLHH
jgi:hypothetical protein